MNARLSTHDLSGALRIAVARLSRRLRAEKEDDELSDSQTADARLPRA